MFIPTEGGLTLSEIGIDLREEFDELLLRWGYGVPYYSRTKMPCSACQGEEYESCQTCLGTGVKLIKETKRVRRRLAAIPETWPRAITTRPVGEWMVTGYTYWMRYDTNPKHLDLIIDTAEDGFKQILEVNLVDPLRGEGGRIEYYRVAVAKKATKVKFI